MARYILYRLLFIIPLLFVVSILVFLLIALLPGDPIDYFSSTAGTSFPDPAQIAEIRAKNHLDDPLPVQYWYWVQDAVQGDFGVSRYSAAPVSEDLANRVPVTLGLVAYAAALALLIGVPLGVIAGIRPGRVFDSGATLFAGLMLAIPSFLIAYLLMVQFGVNVRWFPIVGYTNFVDSPVGWLQHMTLPALALSLHPAAVVFRQLRAGVIDDFDSRYVTAAWARGGTRAGVIGKHVLRNASLPAFTVFGVQVAYLLGGTVIVEQIFSIPGIGGYLFTAIKGRDLPVIQGCVMVFVILQVLIVLVVDILYGYLNPKLRTAEA